MQLMEDASEDKFEKVLVYEPSRLFCNTSKILEFRNGLEQMGIELKSAKGDFEDLHISIK
uniref:recombinase family protein n=1 Tax=Paenibacillus sp. FSL E2-0178 TaxID=2921361 RepID=UPI00406CCF25